VEHEELRAYARLALEIGNNLQPGQDLAISGMIEHAPLARALAHEAYALGARYVDVWYWEPHAKHARVRHAPAETLSWTPPWFDARNEYLTENNAATITITGDPQPDLLSDADPVRAGLDRMPALASRYKALMSGAINWTIVPYPTAGWAETAFGEPDVERLWGYLRSFLRLDQPDPVGAWRDHVHRLSSRAAHMNERGFDALHYRGPGTNLTVGLIQGGRWSAAEMDTTWGVTYRPNLPTEEIFTSPDRNRADGVVRSTRPLATAGTVVRDLELTMADGVITEVRASSGAEVVEGQIDADEGGRHLGEIALVDGTSPIGRSGVVFYDTLLDENATCHIAWGSGLPSTLEDATQMSPDEMIARGLNKSDVHTDFMVGGPELDVDGLTKDGARVPLLRDEVWQL